MSFKVVDRTEEQLNQLARDTVAEKIFWGSYIPEKGIPEKEAVQTIRMVFMPIAFMDEPEPEELEKIGDFFEYMEKAGPRSVNGYPCFMSFNILSKHDFPLFWEKLKKLYAAIDGAL